MPEVILYGASDDLIEVEGYIRDEFYLDGNDAAGIELAAPGGDTMVVEFKFGKVGWIIRMHNYEDDIGVQPSWPMHWTRRPDRPEDPALVVEVPEGTTATKIGDNND